MIPIPEDDEARAAHLARMEQLDLTPDGVSKDWFRTTFFVCYEPSTGRIKGAGTMSIAAVRHMAAENVEDGYLMQAGTLDDHYVDVAAEQVMARTPCPAQLNGGWLRGLPLPCRIIITDEAGGTTVHECNEAEAECAFSDPGTYTITVESVPHHLGTYVVEIAP